MTEIEKIIEKIVKKSTCNQGTRHDVPVYELEGDPEDLISAIATALSDKVVVKEEVVKTLKKISKEHGLFYEEETGLFDGHFLDLLDLFELEGKK